MHTDCTLIKGWLEEKNITDIQIIDISHISSDMDAFVIGTASNERLAKAAVEFVEEKAEAAGYVLKGREGERGAKWLLLDYGDVIVHVFLEDERKNYNLEKLWIDGKIITTNDK
ncbi:MAG: ribosome silencing factor [Anaerofustis stercorihominis]|nr:ribosome silencing factor [Anaerofustis stercorihominis]